MHCYSLLLAMAWAGVAAGELGVDVAGTVHTESTWRCMKQAGISFMMSRAWHSTGSYDSTAAGNLQMARAGGVTNTSVYMFPCSLGKSAASQVDAMVSSLESAGVGHLYDTVWLDVEYNPDSACSWAHGSIVDNCNFILALAKAVESHGKRAGIYSNYYEWGAKVMFNDYGACHAAAAYPLWYAHFDNAQSFNDYQQFGGWARPSIKQYQGTVNVCGASVDRNWKP